MLLFVFCCVCGMYERWLCCGRVLLALRDGRLCVGPSAVVDCGCCSCVFSSQCELACVKDYPNRARTRGAKVNVLSHTIKACRKGGESEPRGRHSYWHRYISRVGGACKMSACIGSITVCFGAWCSVHQVWVFLRRCCWRVGLACHLKRRQEQVDLGWLRGGSPRGDRYHQR